MPQDNTTTYATVQEVAEQFSVTEVTVRRMCARGELTGAVRFGGVWRIPHETLAAIAAAGTTRPPTAEQSQP